MPTTKLTPQHSDAFRERRMKNWLVLGLTYAAMYMARYNFAFANKILSDKYGLSRSQIGLIISLSSLLYGLSAIFNGPIADRIGGRKAMLIGATGACFFNVMFGLAAYLGAIGSTQLLLVYLCTTWALNMHFQSYSALALIKVNSAWFHVSERGVFSAIFGSMIQSGRFFVNVLMTTALVVVLPWQWKFFLPAIIVGIFTIATALVVRDSPAEAGLDDFDTQDATSGDTGPADLAYMVRKIFTNPVLVTIAAAELCTGVARKGFDEWFPRYMEEAQHLKPDSPVFAKNAITIVIAAVGGAFAAGFASDRLFRNRRPPVAFIGYVLQLAAMLVVWAAPSIGLVTVAFVVNSFGISMVQSMLSGTAPMDFGGKRAAATAAGFLDGMQYVGGAISGWGLGWLIDTRGWGVWGPSLVGFSFAGAVLMLVLWNARPGSPSH